MSETILQALIRFGRTIGAAAVAAALLALGDLVAGLSLDATMGTIVLLVLTAVLNALGKLLRGPDAPVDPTFGITRSRARSKAFWLPI